LLKGVLVHIVKVSSSTIKTYTHVDNRSIGQVKSPLYTTKFGVYKTSDSHMNE